MEHITMDKPVQVNITQKVPKQRQKSITANSFILSAAITIAVLVIAAFFAEYANINIDLSLQSLTIKAAVIGIGVFSIGYLIKKYSMNEGKRSIEFNQAKEKAKTALEGINNGESAFYIAEYCLDYAKNAQINERKRLLEDCGISYADFNSLYIGKSKRDILREAYIEKHKNDPKNGKLKRWFRYYVLGKDRELTNVQLKAIKNANSVKYEVYDPDFLRDNEWETRTGLVPSSEYNVRAANMNNNITSAVLGLLSASFGAYFAGGILFNFSLATLYMAIIEALIIFFNVVLKYLFGKKLVLMEISRYNLKVSESANFKIWFDKKNKEITEKNLTKSGENDIIISPHIVEA